MYNQNDFKSFELLTSLQKLLQTKLSTPGPPVVLFSSTLDELPVANPEVKYLFL